jgi:hypothetical protein
VLELQAPLHYKRGAAKPFISREIDKTGFKREIPISPDAQAASSARTPSRGWANCSRSTSLRTWRIRWRRRRERTLLRDFEKAAPRIYGALLSGLVGAIALEETAVLPELPRMADFAAFATAAETALGFETGAFMAAYAHNQEQVADVALEADAVALAV